MRASMGENGRCPHPDRRLRVAAGGLFLRFTSVCCLHRYTVQGLWYVGYHNGLLNLSFTNLTVTDDLAIARSVILVIGAYRPWKLTKDVPVSLHQLRWYNTYFIFKHGGWAFVSPKVTPGPFH